MKSNIVLIIIFSLVIILYVSTKLKEGFSPYLFGYDMGFPYFQHHRQTTSSSSDEPIVVSTSGTDTLTPLPYWVAYGAPGYWPYSMSPYWYYDVDWYGPPSNVQWVGPSPWIGGRDHYRPGHGPGYSGVAGGGFGSGHGGHGGGGGGGHH